MTCGIVSDIREFTLHDGPGLRTTVFLKGCPLRCSWCHNPETQRSEPQTIESAGHRRVVGTRYEPDRLASLLNRQAPILQEIGGVTFSGGEPLAQAAFLCEVIEKLDGLHVVLDTSGYAEPEAFQRVAAMCNLVYFDLKLIDPELHLRYTGCDNAPILGNLRRLSGMDVPFVVRVPLIPGVTDTSGNLAAIARTVQDLPGLLRVDLLPYNRAAGGKYASLGMTFQPGFDEAAEMRIGTKPFIEANITVHVAGSAGACTDTDTPTQE
jgi:pyruvate formate lyase activating enzyme